MAILARNTEHVIMHLRTVVVDAPIALDHQADQRQTRQPDQAAILSVLGRATQILHGEVRNVSEGGTQILLGQPLRYGSVVTIDYDDNRLLGDVVYCENAQGGWLVGVRVEHALLGLATVASIGECN